MTTLTLSVMYETVCVYDYKKERRKEKRKRAKDTKVEKGHQSKLTVYFLERLSA